ncbi:hypothetical protein LBX01_15640 [Altererythrobacter sp. N1]|nr:hypothetical protein LBX01_15640 [Altererythrobacter sp. N1]
MIENRSSPEKATSMTAQLFAAQLENWPRRVSGAAIKPAKNFEVVGSMIDFGPQHEPASREGCWRRG